MPELWAVLHLPPYRDDPAAGDDPFAHYLDDMLRERREPFPDLGVVAESGLIDPNYYLINGSDVHEAQARSGRPFLPPWLARGPQAEHLFRHRLVSADQSRWWRG